MLRTGNQTLKIDPCVKFNVFSTFVNPSKSTIKALLAARGDTTIDGETIFGLEIEYKFTQKIAGNVKVRFPMVDNYLYESVFEGALWQCMNSNKKIIGYGDSFDYSLKLSKQEYIIQIQVRSRDRGKLKKIISMQMRVDTTLKSSISGNIYKSKRGINLSSTISDPIKLNKYSNKELYIGVPDKLDISGVKEFNSGDILQGYLQFNKKLDVYEPKFRKNGKKYPCSYSVPIICNLSKKLKEPKTDDKIPEIKDEDKSDEETKVSDKHRDALISFVKKLKGKEQIKGFELIKTELYKKYPKHLPLLLLEVNALYSDEDNLKNNIAKIIGLTDNLLKLIDQTEILSHTGKKFHDPNNDKLKKTIKTNKEILIEALILKLSCIKYIIVNNLLNDTNEANELDKFESVLNNLKEFINIDKHKNDKLFKLRIFYLTKVKKFGEALKILNDKLNDDSKGLSKDLFKMKIDILKDNFNDELRFYIEQLMMKKLVEFPPSFDMF